MRLFPPTLRKPPRHALLSGSQRSEPMEHLGRDFRSPGQSLYRKGGVSVKGVLISIRPDWIQKIFSGEKTIEVRKTFPKLPPPFKCFIYCTKPRYDHDDFLMTMKGPLSYYWGGGMVVGEFVCDKISQIPGNGLLDVCCGQLKGTAMSREEFESYLGWGGGYGWHISNLKVYDKPKPLSDFKRWKRAGSFEALERLERAPQSWCYVDGGLIG